MIPRPNPLPTVEEKLSKRSTLNFLVVLWMCLLFEVKVFPQASISTDALRLLDSSLSVLDMNRLDFALPTTPLATDLHSLSSIDRMFSQPLASLDIAQEYADRVRALSRDNTDELFSSISRTARLGVYVPQYYDGLMSADELDSLLGVDLERECGLVGATLLRQYLPSLIRAKQVITQARRSAMMSVNVVEMCDSFLLMSKDEEEQSVYSMRAAEIKSDSVSRAFYNSAALFNLGDVYSASGAVLRTLLKYHEIALQNKKLYSDSITSVVLQTRFGRIALGGSEDNAYTGSYFFVVDIGGNDSYSNTTETKQSALQNVCTAIVDMNGNDHYFGSDYVYGSGVFGAGFLLDYSGDDLYSADNLSLGSAVFGVGVLIDFAGADSYLSKVFTQGAGSFGIGLLIDKEGNDLYRCFANAQGFGGTRGLGCIADFAGNDTYSASSPFTDVLRYDSHYVSFTQGAALGSRPVAAGGFGFLFDYKGNDNYSSDIYGQGTGYWYGLGALIDGEGEDRYTAYQYAQGAGIHFAHGILWDKKGDDAYWSHGVSQGCGHDVGFGGLIDEDGNDSYTAESLSLGAGNANALSLLVDVKGDDSYSATNLTNTFGFSDFRRSYGMIGIFVDGGGNDVYPSRDKNNTSSTQSTFGVFADFTLSTPPPASTEPKLTPPIEKRDPLSTSIDSLFVQGSAAAQKFQYNVEPARKAIVDSGARSLPFLSTKLATIFPRERLAMESILPKLIEKDSMATIKLLLDSMASERIETLVMCATALAKKNVKDIIPKLGVLTTSTNYRLRAFAAQQLGEVSDSSVSSGMLVRLLEDSVPFVRARSAYSLGKLAPYTVLSQLRVAIDDSIQLVRNSAVQGVLRSKPSSSSKLLPMEVLIVAFEAQFSQRATRAIARLVPFADTAKPSLLRFVKFLRSLKRDQREAIYRAVRESNSGVWLRQADAWARSESDAHLKSVLLGRNVRAKKVGGK